MQLSLHSSLGTTALRIMKATKENSFKDVLSTAYSKTDRRKGKEERRRKERREIRNRKTKAPLFVTRENVTLAPQSGVLVGHWRKQPVLMQETSKCSSPDAVCRAGEGVGWREDTFSSFPQLEVLIKVLPLSWRICKLKRAGYF